MNELTVQELTQRLAVLEERMNTRQAQSESAIDRLRADMANWKPDMAKRENRLMLTVFGAVGWSTAILGLLIAID